jgi:hypothetical protein
MKKSISKNRERFLNENILKAVEPELTEEELIEEILLSNDIINYKPNVLTDLKKFIEHISNKKAIAIVRNIVSWLDVNKGEKTLRKNLMSLQKIYSINDYTFDEIGEMNGVSRIAAIKGAKVAIKRMQNALEEDYFN